MTRQGWDEYFMLLAHQAASRATCPRLHVGALIVKDKRIKATGYNGSRPGDVHCDDVGCDIVGSSCVRTVHAEQNAIDSTTRRDRAGTTMYCTDSPCIPCADHIVRSGIIEFVYDRKYEKGYNQVKELFDFHGIILRRL